MPLGVSDCGRNCLLAAASHFASHRPTHKRGPAIGYERAASPRSNDILVLEVGVPRAGDSTRVTGAGMRRRNPKSGCPRPTLPTDAVLPGEVAAT